MKGLLQIVVLAFAMSACKNNTPVVCEETEIVAPQIILVIGQSNTHYGLGLNETLDAPESGIYQLGRFKNNKCVIQACEPLDHHTKADGRIGFALTFGKLYKQSLQIPSDLILVPCGYGGTGFADNRWNKTNDLYEDAVSRVNGLMVEYPNARVSAILWHQGETDVILGNQHYEEDLDNFIVNLRADIGNDTVPFILGGMVAYWVNQSADRQALQQILKDAPNRNSYVGYADPDVPFVIQKADDTFDEIHFDANGQRELGQRYFDAFMGIEE